MEPRRSPKAIWSILNHLRSERKYHPRILPCVLHLCMFIHDNLPHPFRVLLYFGKTATSVLSRTRLLPSRRKITPSQLKHFVVGDTRGKYWERTSASQRRTIAPCWDETQGSCMSASLCEFKKTSSSFWNASKKFWMLFMKLLLWAMSVQWLTDRQMNNYKEIQLNALSVFSHTGAAGKLA